MNRLSPQFLDELRARTTLSTLVGTSVKLERAGREWRACCPFHNEKSPSFYVNDDKGFYHCFGCSAHGDAIRWLTDARGLPFIDAVKELADSAGMDLPAPDPRAAERAQRALGLADAVEAAASWFAEQLRSDGGADTRAYLAKRGIAADTITAFGLGFAPDSKTALKTALASFGDAMLVEAGLLIAVDDKAPYDRFRGRLIIPICDVRGRTIAFGGRILGIGEPKYLNSPETPLFDKGRTLFNLDRAGAAARKADRLIVVEGYLDVIALAQAGIVEAVAPLGTALTEAQLERLWRVVDVPTICFDGDGAGRKAAIRAAERALPLLGPGRSLAFAMLPAGQDPDDLVRSNGTAAFGEVLERALPLVEVLWRHEYELEALATPEARAGLKRRLTAHVGTIADGDVRRHYAEDYRRRFDETFFPRTPLVTRTPSMGRTGAREPWGRRNFQPPAPLTEATRAIGDTGKRGGIDGITARAVMAGLLRFPDVIGDSAAALTMLHFVDPALDRLRLLLLDSCSEVAVDRAHVDTICEVAGLLRLANELRRSGGLAFSFARGDADAVRACRELKLAIETLAARPELDAAISSATAALAEAFDEDGFAEQTRLIAVRSDADRALGALSVGEE